MDQYNLCDIVRFVLSHMWLPVSCVLHGSGTQIQSIQLKSGPYLVFTKKYPFVYLISTKICGEIL